MSNEPFVSMLELTRGRTVESVHCGALAVVNAQGSLIASNGDPYQVTFLRSTAKPFQALPFIEAGGDQRYHLTPEEIALICASHSGTDEHVRVLHGLQAKVGVAESELMCGVHPSYHKETAEAMLLRAETPTSNRHNCSGKHTGMLAFAKMRGEETESYLEPSHPLQQRILNTFAEMCGVAPDAVALGTDGCSAPNFAVPLYNAAWALARLVDPSGLPPARARACRTIVQAMMAHPDMVGGPERFDTDIMQVGAGRIVVKAGAEGYQGIGLLPGALGKDSPALGIALKVSDGDGYGRARPAITLEVLCQLGALSPQDLEKLSAYGPMRNILNWRKLVVGEMRPVFTLEKN